MSDEIDPEVVADLKLRAYSERDRSRSRGADYAWKPPTIVTQWKCRTPPCKEFVDVTEETIERWEIFNRQLSRMGEGPLVSHTILWCDSCLAEHAKLRPVKLRKRVERMADVIKQLKAGDKIIRYRTDEGDHADDRGKAFDRLREWGHPDVPGLISSLAEKAAASPGKRERRGGM
jgi:hypothetical protein